MNIGVFLLIEPFASVERQLQRAKAMGFTYADITDTNAGGSMLGTAGFSPTVSLDENPFEIRRLFEKYGMSLGRRRDRYQRSLRCPPRRPDRALDTGNHRLGTHLEEQRRLFASERTVEA